MQRQILSNLISSYHIFCGFSEVVLLIEHWPELIVSVSDVVKID